MSKSTRNTEKQWSSSDVKQLQQLASPWTSALVLLGAVWLGHQLDEAVLPSCPTCKVVLEKFV